MNEKKGNKGRNKEFKKERKKTERTKDEKEKASHQIIHSLSDTFKFGGKNTEKNSRQTKSA